MKKSALATVTPKVLQRKPKGTNNETTMSASATATSQNTNNNNNVAAPASSHKQVGKPLEIISSPVTAITALHEPKVTKNRKPTTKFTQKVETGNSRRNARVIIDNDESNNSSEESEEEEEDIDYDEEAVRKLLERKIEQAPAAKVIVSEAMMRDALSEINARKSVTSTAVQSCSQSVVTLFSSGDVSRDQNLTTATSSSVSVSSAVVSGTMEQTTQKISGHGKVNRIGGDGGGGGDAPVADQGQHYPSVASFLNEGIENSGNSNVNLEDGEVTDSTGCPLEKILEFLQAVMTKKYKKALVLAKEVEKYEPNNELVLEYMTVLEKIVSKEEENNNYSQGIDSDGSYEDVPVEEYSDELTTSSETDSVSGEESGESSAESRSYTSTSGEESDEKESQNSTAKPEVVKKDSEGNKNGENASAEKDKESSSGGKRIESRDNGHAVVVGRAQDGEIQCGADEEHNMNAGNVEFNGEMRS